MFLKKHILSTKNNFIYFLTIFVKNYWAVFSQILPNITKNNLSL
jgi:hypothetical protein